MADGGVETRLVIVNATARTVTVTAIEYEDGAKFLLTDQPVEVDYRRVVGSWILPPGEQTPRMIITDRSRFGISKSGIPTVEYEELIGWLHYPPACPGWQTERDEHGTVQCACCRVQVRHMTKIVITKVGTGPDRMAS